MKQIEEKESIRYFILSYNNGAIDINIPIVLNDENKFCGLDSVNNFVFGRFIDDEYILLYFIKDNEVVRKYIGMNAITHISIRLDGTNISTGLHINDNTWNDIEKEELIGEINDCLNIINDELIESIENDEQVMEENIHKNNKKRKVEPISKLHALM